jgi:hypothetical protein
LATAWPRALYKTTSIFASPWRCVPRLMLILSLPLRRPVGGGNHV